jgi:hypothetical protein
MVFIYNNYQKPINIIITWHEEEPRSMFDGPRKAPDGGGCCRLSCHDVKFPSLVEAAGRSLSVPVLSPFEIRTFAAGSW